MSTDVPTGPQLRRHHIQRTSDADSAAHIDPANLLDGDNDDEDAVARRRRP